MWSAFAEQRWNELDQEPAEQEDVDALESGVAS